MSWPPTVTVPAEGVTMPQTMLMSVVLPAPFGPSSAKISPSRISRSMRFSALSPDAYVLDIPAMEMIGDMRLAPVDGAEALAAEVRIVKADGRPGLGNVAEVRKGRVAARPEVLDREPVLAAQARGEREIGACDVVVAASACAADLADEEVARRRIERP